VKKLKKSDVNTDTLMKWANRNLGPSRCKKIRIVSRKCTYHGWYDWFGTVYINIRHVGSMTSIYRTLAHEWTHAQQKRVKYLAYNRKYGYRDNPFEVDARQRERTCFSETFVPL
jgi:hypothetical protein